MSILVSFAFSNRTLVLFILAFFCALNQACGGGECASDKTVLVDFDSDCVNDDDDNCVLEGDPAGSYNPDQYDGNNNGVGQPCDPFDAESLITASAYWESRFNMAGDYEFTDAACPGLTRLNLEQNETR